MAVQNQLNGAQKRITQSGFKIEQGFGLGAQNAARQRQQVVGVCKRGFIYGTRGWVCGHGVRQRYDCVRV